MKIKKILFLILFLLKIHNVSYPQDIVLISNNHNTNQTDLTTTYENNYHTENNETNNETQSQIEQNNYESTSNFYIPPITENIPSHQSEIDNNNHYCTIQNSNKKTSKEELKKIKSDLCIRAQNLKKNIEDLQLKINITHTLEIEYQNKVQELDYLICLVLKKEIALLSQTIAQEEEKYEKERYSIDKKISELENNIHQIQTQIIKKEEKLKQIESKIQQENACVNEKYTAPPFDHY